MTQRGLASSSIVPHDTAQFLTPGLDVLSTVRAQVDNRRTQLPS